MELEFSQHIFEKYTNIKLHQNSCSGSRIVPCGRTEMTKLIVAFRNSAKVPRNGRKVCRKNKGTLSWIAHVFCIAYYIKRNKIAPYKCSTKANNCTNKHTEKAEQFRHLSCQFTCTLRSPLFVRYTTNFNVTKETPHFFHTYYLSNIN